MLQKLAHQITDAHIRAAEWEERSREAHDERSRIDALRLAKGWSNLAKGYAFVEELQEFLLTSRKQQWFKVEDLPKPPDDS